MFELSEAHVQIRDLAREFARNEILPGSSERDRTGEFPADLFAKLAELGFLGMFVPEAYGGAGLDVLAYVIALEEVSYADAAVGTIMSVQNSLVSWPILAFGSEEQKQRWLPRLAKGEVVGCYALTEPGSGSDAAAMKTRALPQGDGYRLDGTKMWITNGPQAGLAVTYASLDTAQKHKAVCAFLVDTKLPGCKVGRIEEKMGIHSSQTSELLFEGCVVPKDALVGEERAGFKVAMATLDGGRIGIAAQALGIAQRCLDLASAYAGQRLAFGQPIGNLQAIQWKLADMKVRIEAARLLTWRAAALRDRHEKATPECSMAKLFASETANFCAYEAGQIHGGYGYSREYEVERLYRDARITTLYEGTSEIQRLVIAKHVLAGS